MEIHPLLPDLFFRQLEERNLEGVRRSIDQAGTLGDGWRLLIRGLRRAAGHAEPEPGVPPAAVVVDAVHDLIPTLEDGDPSPLLEALACYLMAHPQADPRIDFFDEPTADPPPDIVPITLLEDALSDGNLESICRVAGRLVRVIRTREYFLELLLELLAADRDPAGALLVHSNATVKSLHELDWEVGRGLAYRLLEAASARPIESLPGSYDDLPPVPCRAAFAASLDLAEPEPVWLYLAHAFQADRYAQLRRKGVRAGIRAWIADALFQGDAQTMDRLEERSETRGPLRPLEHASPLPPEEGEAIAAELVGGAPHLAREMARRVCDAADVDPLYGWLALGAAVWLRQGDARPILAVNAARWGTHLVGGMLRGSVTERLIERSLAWDRPQI